MFQIIRKGAPGVFRGFVFWRAGIFTANVTGIWTKQLFLRSNKNVAASFDPREGKRSSSPVFIIKQFSGFSSFNIHVYSSSSSRLLSSVLTSPLKKKTSHRYFICFFKDCIAIDIICAYVCVFTLTWGSSCSRVCRCQRLHSEEKTEQGQRHRFIASHYLKLFLSDLIKIINKRNVVWFNI